MSCISLRFLQSNFCHLKIGIVLFIHFLLNRNSYLLNRNSFIYSILIFLYIMFSFPFFMEWIWTFSIMLNWSTRISMSLCLISILQIQHYFIWENFVDSLYHTEKFCFPWFLKINIMNGQCILQNNFSIYIEMMMLCITLTTKCNEF